MSQKVLMEKCVFTGINLYTAGQATKSFPLGQEEEALMYCRENGLDVEKTRTDKKLYVFNFRRERGSWK